MKKIHLKENYSQNFTTIVSSFFYCHVKVIIDLFLADLKFKWNVLATDYKNYALTYSCSNLPDGKSFQMAWLNSRSSQLDESVIDEVDKFISDHFTPESMFPNYQEDDYCSPRPF